MRLRRANRREKALDLLLQALGLLCEFASRPEDQLGGSPHLARRLRDTGNVLHDTLSALRSLLHASSNFLGCPTLLLHSGGDCCSDLIDLPDGGADIANRLGRCPGGI